jgi:plasmid maintenance system antidote protein VapI
MSDRDRAHPARAPAAGPSVSALARDAGGDRSVLSRFLAGKRTITLETADRLAAVLKLRLIAGR